MLQVLLIEDDQDKANAFIEVLDNTNYVIKHISKSSIPLLVVVERMQPDVIIMDIEAPDRDVLDSLNIISVDNPKPIVMFSEQGDTEMINQLIKSGVSAYMVGDVAINRVRSILDTAIARFSEYQQLKQELAKTKEKLTHQKTIEQAKIWLMQTKDLSEKDAYHSIRKMAMDNGQKLEDVAKNILSLAQMLETSS